MASFMGHNRADVSALAHRGGVEIRRLVCGEAMDLGEYTVPAGFTTGPSDHDAHEKIGYVVSGKVEISTGEGAFVIEAGGAYAIPRGLPHQYTVVEDAVIVQVRSPGADPPP